MLQANKQGNESSTVTVVLLIRASSSGMIAEKALANGSVRTCLVGFLFGFGSGSSKGVLPNVFFGGAVFH